MCTFGVAASPSIPCSLSAGEEVGAGHPVDLGLSSGKHPVRALYVQFPAAVQQVSGDVCPLWECGEHGWAWNMQPFTGERSPTLCHVATFRPHPGTASTPAYS